MAQIVALGLLLVLIVVQLLGGLCVVAPGWVHRIAPGWVRRLEQEGDPVRLWGVSLLTGPGLMGLVGYDLVAQALVPGSVLGWSLLFLVLLSGLPGTGMVIEPFLGRNPALGMRTAHLPRRLFWGLYVGQGAVLVVALAAAGGGRF